MEKNNRKINLILLAAQLTCGNYFGAAKNLIKNWKFFLSILCSIIMAVILMASILVSLPGIIMQSMLHEDREVCYKDLSLFAKNEILETEQEKKSFLENLITSLQGESDEEGTETEVVVDTNVDIDYQDILTLYSVKYGEYSSQDKLDKDKIRILTHAFIKKEEDGITIKSFGEVVEELNLTEEQITIALSMHDYYMGEYADYEGYEGKDTGDESVKRIGNGLLSKPIYGGRLTSNFGWRIHPISGKKKFHSGIDLAIAEGTPVRAAYEGTVTTAKYSKSYGYHVIIDHGSINGKHIVTCYAHNRSLTVRKGQKVELGQIIAFSGSTGDSTGPHVHFEVRVDGEVDNPLSWI